MQFKMCDGSVYAFECYLDDGDGPGALYFTLEDGPGLPPGFDQNGCRALWGGKVRFAMACAPFAIEHVPWVVWSRYADPPETVSDPLVADAIQGVVDGIIGAQWWRRPAVDRGRLRPITA